jgi:hypothetical protein
MYNQSENNEKGGKVMKVIIGGFMYDFHNYGRCLTVS